VLDVQGCVALREVVHTCTVLQERGMGHRGSLALVGLVVSLAVSLAVEAKGLFTMTFIVVIVIIINMTMLIFTFDRTLF
jgi:hypothetical protein